MSPYLELQSRFRGAQCGKAEITHAEGFRLFRRVKWVTAYEMLPGCLDDSRVWPYTENACG